MFCTTDPSLRMFHFSGLEVNFSVVLMRQPFTDHELSNSLCSFLPGLSHRGIHAVTLRSQQDHG